MTGVAALLQQGANNAGLFVPSAVLLGALHGLEAQDADHRQRPLYQPEAAYLLQRLEAPPGTVILTSNLRGNIDGTFARRFQSQMSFPMPACKERPRTWQVLLCPPCPVQLELELEGLAQEYQLSGDAITNAVKHSPQRLPARALRLQQPCSRGPQLDLTRSRISSELNAKSSRLSENRLLALT